MHCLGQGLADAAVGLPNVYEMGSNPNGPELRPSKRGRFPTFPGSIMRFCGGNLPIAEKLSLFPLSCCVTRRNTLEP
jgi:hypothetical protein